MTVPHWAWAAFTVFVLFLLALDLWAFQRSPRPIGMREAMWRVAGWASLALGFCVLLWFWLGRQAALTFLTGYVIEQSLSVDNMFVFVLIFSSFMVPSHLQARVLFWGILGALIMRAIMILAGTALFHAFAWVPLIFGAFLVLTGGKLAMPEGEAAADLFEKRWIRWLRRVLPLTSQYEGEAFFVRREGRTLVTPLFLVLIVIEVSDLIFAVDSIPAILAITSDPFLVYTSNVFAILGLRSLYFLLAGAASKFHYLKNALAVILVFIGLKMMTETVLELSGRTELSAKFHHAGVPISLGFIVLTLLVATMASLVRERRLRDAS